MHWKNILKGEWNENETNSTRSFAEVWGGTNKSYGYFGSVSRVLAPKRPTRMKCPPLACPGDYGHLLFCSYCNLCWFWARQSMASPGTAVELTHLRGTVAFMLLQEHMGQLLCHPARGHQGDGFCDETTVFQWRYTAGTHSQSACQPTKELWLSCFFLGKATFMDDCHDWLLTDDWLTPLCGTDLKREIETIMLADRSKDRTVVDTSSMGTGGP